MRLDDLKARVNALVEAAQRVATSGRVDSYNMRWLDVELKAEVRSSGLAFLERVYGKESPHYTSFYNVSSDINSFLAALGVLRSAKDEIDGGWIFELRSLVASSIFSDYLDMAAHLREEGYKDAAAVLAGSTLEEHLRRLCESRGIDTEVEKDGRMMAIKADRLNAELAKADVYGKLDLKNVTAWLDLRNHAAHGHYDEYSAEQVALLIQSIRDFISRHSA